MDKLFAFAWLILIGSNVAHHYSNEVPYHGAVILAGGAYCAIFFRKELLRLIFLKDYLLVLSLLVVPLILMMFSDRLYERNAYTSQIGVAMVFVVASALALRGDLNRTLALAVFVIVGMGSAMNLYELLIENNKWSSAPGRSAGFYGNPTISGEALLGYGLVFLTDRVTKLRFVDLILIALVVVGVFATFSRAGVLASLLLLTATILMRVRREYVMRILVGLMAISLAAFGFVSYVIHHIDLSNDALLRIASLLESGGLGDYGTDRGYVATEALDLIETNPFFGAGFLASTTLPQGPHNMFVAMMVDFGILGLIIYLTVIVRLIQVARSASGHLSRQVLFFVGWLVIFSFASHNLVGNIMTLPLLGFALARAYQIQALASQRFAFTRERRVQLAANRRRFIDEPAK